MQKTVNKKLLIIHFICGSLHYIWLLFLILFGIGLSQRKGVDY
jgi:hypothetical protein